MFVTMTCSCGADLELDIQDNDNLVLLWAQRFTDSHTSCGFMTPVVKDAPEKAQKTIELPQKRVE